MIDTVYVHIQTQPMPSPCNHGLCSCQQAALDLPLIIYDFPRARVYVSPGDKMQEEFYPEESKKHLPPPAFQAIEMGLEVCGQ